MRQRNPSSHPTLRPETSGTSDHVQRSSRHRRNAVRRRDAAAERERIRLHRDEVGQDAARSPADNVGCESDSNAPVVDGQPANGVEVSSGGSSRWVLGNLGAMPTTTIDYGTYSAVGWTIVADSTGTTFTNDGTGHGMFVSTDRVDFF